MVLIIFSIVLVGCTKNLSPKENNNKPIQKSGLQVCPDQWIDNQMPGSIGSQYFVLNGETRKINEFDMNWIQNNCDIKKQVVL